MKLNYMAAFTDTGYGVVGRSLMTSLHELGYDLKIYDIANEVHLTSEKENAIYKASCDNGRFFFPEAPCVRVWHQHELDQWAGGGAKIAFPIFELDKFSPLERHHLTFPDKLAVCSEWAKGIIKDELDIEAFVVPLGVDSKMFRPASTQMNPLTPFTFINIGKWEIRKGHDILWDIFNRAFKPDDKVQLNILASNAWSSEKEREDWVRLYKNTPMGKKIHFTMGVNSHHDVATMMKASDAGIFPARAEGWNLELLEMMACGKPVVTTGYGAHLEFCNEENSHLVYPENIEPAADGKFFFGQGNWASLEDKEIDEFALKMRHVFEEWKFNEAGVKTAEELSWKNSAKKLSLLF